MNDTMLQTIDTPITKVSNEWLSAKLEFVNAWDAYSLAQTYLAYKFPEHYYEYYGDEDYKDYYEDYGYKDIEVSKEVELLKLAGCDSWEDAILAYNNEIGWEVDWIRGFLEGVGDNK